MLRNVTSEGQVGEKVEEGRKKGEEVDELVSFEPLYCSIVIGVGQVNGD